MSESNNIVNSVVRACHLLECFSKEEPTLVLGELASRVGLAKGTAHRLLRSLEFAGLIARTVEGGYRLGPKLVRLGSIAMSDLELRAVARPIMQELAAGIGETLYLMIPSELGALCVERIDGASAIRVMVMDVGTTLPYHSGAGPAVLLAFNTDELIGFLQEPLEALTDRTMTDKSALLASLPEIRTQGFAQSVDDISRDVAALGVPVRDGNGEVSAALSVAGLKDHILRDRDLILKGLDQASLTISRGLGATL